MMQEWFKKARLGIFIHYGIYAVEGTMESWAFRWGQMTYKRYMRQLNGFTASKYDAKEWAKLFKEAGASYAVLTSKHHDGVALFDSKYSDFNVVKATPCGRDLIRPYCDALREEGLRVGIYFTQCDWSHPDYTSHDWKGLKYFIDKKFNKSVRWERFLKFHRNQLTEILTNYGQIDLLWFDGDWERSGKEWRFKEMKEYIEKISPNTVVNSRIGIYGDYETPEQQIPTLPPDKPWEYCMTINDNWGWRPKDNNYKSPNEILSIFIETISMGGNLLLDIGPKEDGTIDERYVRCLKTIGKFIYSNYDAVYNSHVIDNVYYSGAAMGSDDNKKLYLFENGKPMDVIYVKNLKDKVNKVTVKGVDAEFVQDEDKLYICPPKIEYDGATVITVDFGKEVEL